MPDQSTTSLLRKNRLPSRLIVRFMWTFCVLFFLATVAAFFYPIHYQLDGLLRVDHLSLVMGTAVTLFSSIVLSYSSRYMAGSAHLLRFLTNCVLFTFSVIIMITADNIIFFIAAWFCMGFLMAKLIGDYTHIHEGRISKWYAGGYFLLSTLLLSAGMILLALKCGSWRLSVIEHATQLSSQPEVQIALLLLIGAAMVQAALFPFQRWLMSSMTAPTPASALMHAGFVNSGAILLTRVAPLLFAGHLLWVLVIIGGIGALIGKFSKFVQPNIKQKLACSTTAQMGYMILECGLGFFTAAIAHLILHGFYKAYLFLSSGDTVVLESPDAEKEQRWKQQYLPITIISGIVGGVIFAYVTGKGFALNSSLFLTFVVALTVIHGTQDLLKHSSLPIRSRFMAIPIIIVPALVSYALIYDGISDLFSSVPMSEVSTPITTAQLFIAGLYLITFLAIELKWYQKSRRLYVFLLNRSQPKSKTMHQ